MGNNSLFMEYPNTLLKNNNNKLYYIPFTKRNMSYVSLPKTEAVHNLNNNNNDNYYITQKKHVNNNDNLNRKSNNNSTIEIINNNNISSNISNNSQCYKKDSCNLLRNSNYNYNNRTTQEEHLIKNFYKNPNIKIIHTKSSQAAVKENNNKKVSGQIDKRKKSKNSNNSNNNNNNNNNINFNQPSTSYLHLKKNSVTNNRNTDMKPQISVISKLHLDSFNNVNDNIISAPYVTPMYYTSSVPLTSTTIATTTANINDTASSLLNSYFSDRNEQYLMNNNNDITYIINSNQNEKPINPSTPSKNATLVNAINNSPTPSSYTRNSDDNTQVKSLIPMKYYTNSFLNSSFYLNSNEMTSPITTSNPMTTTNSLNDTIANTQLISSKTASQSTNTLTNYFPESIVIKNVDDMSIQQISSTSPQLNPMRNSVESHYTNEQEKIRGPMMYSTTTTSTNNLMNISPIVTKIITKNSNTTSNVNNANVTSTTSSNTSSTISILSTASSAHSTVVLKDAGLTCSPESTDFHDHMAKKAKSQTKSQTKSTKPSSKHSKKKSTTSLSDKSGIIGFAAEILTSVLPTSSNNLKHPKTRYLPELYPFIKKIAHKCKIDIRTFLYALVYSQRFAEALLSHHKEAVGEYGTNHRIFLASILLAYQYQINHGIKVNFKLDAKKLSKYTDGVWTEKEVEMMCKALQSTKNFSLDIDDNVVKQFVETHKADLCWYS